MHGELAKLGISISQAAVSKYMVRHRTPPSHTWRSFLDNHANDLVSLDFFTLPTATFRVLFVFIVLRHERRRIVHFNVTEHPSAEWFDPVPSINSSCVRLASCLQPGCLGRLHVGRFEDRRRLYSGV